MATGVTEIIRLFAGHFHLSDEVARMRQSYDEFMAQREREDFHPGSHHATHKSPDLDEFDTASRYLDPQSMAPGLIGYGPASAEPFHTKARPPDINAIIDERVPHDFPSSPGAPFLLVAPDLLQLVADEPAIHVSYDTGGDQSLIQVHQLNVMWDNDITVSEGWSVDALSSLQVHDIAETLAELHDQANAELPPEFANSPSIRRPSLRSPANTTPRGKPRA